MRTEGTLKSWMDDRGFGFIATAGGDIFLHISALPQTGRRPQVGERLSFTIEAGPDGKKRAVGAIYLDAPVGAAADIPARAPRPAPPRPREHGRNAHARHEHGRRERHHRRREPSSRFQHMLLTLGVMSLFLGGFWLHDKLSTPAPVPTSPLPVASAPTPSRAAAFSCDGRTHCSQMRSCDEARFFLRQCPGVAMDGDGDGNPCEEQHCGH
jgi:cold shock CspA family protein